MKRPLCLAREGNGVSAVVGDSNQQCCLLMLFVDGLFAEKQYILVKFIINISLD